MSDGLRRESRRIESIGSWLEQRKSHITASRMGALFDAHPYLSREDLAGELQGQSTKGSTPAMRRGRIFEAAILAALQEEHPDWDLRKADSYYSLPQQRVGATPDFLWGEDGLIEAKTVRPQVWDSWHGRPNLAYVLQLLTGLLCTGRQHGILAVMVMSSEFPVYEFAVERHPAAEQRILDAVAAWWEQYDHGELAAPADAAAIEQMLDTGEHLDWSDNDEVREILEERRELKSQISIATQQLGACEYQLKNRLGPASTAWLPGWSVSFRRVHRREYTVPAGEYRTLKIRETRDDHE